MQLVPVAQIPPRYLVTVAYGLSRPHGALCVCLSKQNYEIGGCNMMARNNAQGRQAAISKETIVLLTLFGIDA